MPCDFHAKDDVEIQRHVFGSAQETESIPLTEYIPFPELTRNKPMSLTKHV